MLNCLIYNDEISLFKVSQAVHYCICMSVPVLWPIVALVNFVVVSLWTKTSLTLHESLIVHPVIICTNHSCSPDPLLYVWSFGIALWRTWTPPPPTYQFTLAFHWLLYPHRWDSSKSHSRGRQMNNRPAVMGAHVKAFSCCRSFVMCEDQGADGLHQGVHMWVMFFFQFKVRCVSDISVKSPTQAVSRADVDLKDGHTAPFARPRFTFDDDLINDTWSVIPRSEVWHHKGITWG